jgi:hypothetical protein
VLPDADVDGLQRATGREVHVLLDAVFDVAATRHRLLNDAVLGLHNLARGSGRAGGGTDLGDGDGDHDDGY